MKVLYIANYKDGTGWANAALNNILALDSAGVNVVPRAISFNGRNVTVPQRVYELEDNSSSGSDICIQHTLPPYYSYNSKVKNIGFYVTETNTFSDTMWQKSINIMDEAWVPNKQIVDASRKSGVKVPIKIAPHSLDMREYENIPESASVEQLRGNFNFCFVGDFIHRKNIAALLRAFHSEFHPAEPVNLFLKLSKHGYSSEECLNSFNAYSKNIKQSLKLRQKYRDEVVVCGFLEKRHMLSIMSECHCFVAPSYGEAWCIPALEAMALKMPVIYTEGTGMDDFCYGYAAPAKSVPCYGALDSLPSVYTADSKWQEVDVQKLSQLMRSVYETYMSDKDEFQQKQNKARQRALQYDTKKVGLQLKELLYDS
jgi:glycosyltransferase involved in cell wall biosynthesis